MNKGKNSQKFAAGDHDVARDMEMLAKHKNLVGFNVDQIKHTCYCGKDAEDGPSLKEFSENKELTWYDEGLLWAFDAGNTVMNAADNALDTVIDFGDDALDTVIDIGSDVMDDITDTGNEVIDFVAPVVAPVVDVVVAPVVDVVITPVVDFVDNIVDEVLCFGWWC